MKKCPYCLAEIGPAAQKCMHCGEWVVAPQKKNEKGISKAELDESLKTVNFIAQWKIIGMIISIPIAILIFIIFINVASTNKNKDRHDQFMQELIHQAQQESQLNRVEPFVKTPDDEIQAQGAQAQP